MTGTRTVPDSWNNELKEVIEHPDRALGMLRPQVVIPQMAREKYKELHARAAAYAVTKGEHEAMMHVSLYAIWKYGLYKCEYDTWGEYVAEFERLPFAPDRSSIDWKNYTIDRLVEKGVSLDNVIQALAVASGAARKLSDANPEKIPEGDYNRATETLIEVAGVAGRGEAIRTVDDWTDEPSFKVVDAMFDVTNSRVLFKVRVNPRNNRAGYERDYFVVDIEEPEASWLIGRLRPVRRIR